MKKAVILFLGLGVMIASFHPAASYAATEYYVELGKDTSKDEAIAEWKTLVSKHKSLLSHLQFYPKSVIESGVTVSTRIQAGPISNKARAQKICSTLFTNDVPCFVIEGVGAAPPTEIMNLGEKADGKPVKMANLPWLSTSDEVAAPPPVQGTTTLPWLRDNSNKKAHVEVAEAIRVPLTDNFDPQGNGKVTVSSLPDIKPTFRKQFAENRQGGGGNDAGAGWLTIDTFPNEDVATSFWEEVHSTLPKSANHLHVRVMKPLIAQNQSKTSLGIGPFANSSEAYAFCENIQAKDRGLNCSYQGAASDTQLAHGNSYNNRRMAEARKHPLENQLGALAPAAGPSKQYWVQVLSAPNQMEALKQWETMRSSNSDMLNGMRSSVSTSSTDKNSYVVRVGPITSNDDAVKLCTQLQGRGVNCRVLLYSIGL